MNTDKVAAAIIIFCLTIVLPWIGKIYIENQINPLKTDMRVLRTQFNFYLKANDVTILDEFKLREDQ